MLCMLPNFVYHQGPPDLEAWFKKMFAKISGPKRATLKDFKPPEARGFNSWWVIVPFVAVASILLSGVVSVSPDEQTVVTRFGVYQTTLQPGTHWTLPFVDRHISVDITDATQVNISSLMLTQDQDLVNVGVSLSYKVVDPKAYLFVNADVDGMLQASLQSATVQALQHQMIANALNKANFSGIATAIQNNLAVHAATDGIQIQGVSVNSINVPDALNGQFMQAVSAAQNQVKTMMQAAEDYSKAVTPVAVARAAELQRAANLKRAAVIVAAQANVAEFNALFPIYQKDPAATLAYLPLVVASDIRSLAPQASGSSSTPGSSATAQSAYARWRSANQSQVDAQQQNQN
jgi:membrane protease subunit HflK